MYYSGRLKSLEDIDINSYACTSDPILLKEMSCYFGRENMYIVKGFNYYKIDRYFFAEEWFEWIKDENGNLIYGNDDFTTSVKSMFDDLLEDI